MDLPELLSCLLPKAASWKSIGAVLGLSKGELSTVGAGSSDEKECLRRVLQEWRHKNPNSTWEEVIRALGAPLLGEMELAMELEQRRVPVGTADSQSEVFHDPQTSVKVSKMGAHKNISRSRSHEPLHRTRPISAKMDQISEEQVENPADGCRQHVPVSHTSSFPRSSRVNKKRRLAPSRSARSRVKSDGDLKQDQGNTGAEDHEGVATTSGCIQRKHRTVYAKPVRASSDFFPLRVFEKIKTFNVEFVIPNAELSVHMEIRGDFTIGQIKENLWSSLSDHMQTDEFGSWWDPDCFTFTYEMNNEKYELYDDQQIFQMAQVIQLWRSEKRSEGQLMVEAKKEETKEEKTLNMEISAMIGTSLNQLQFDNNDELDITRRKLVSVRRKAVKSRDAMQYSMEMDITFRTIPPHIISEINKDGKTMTMIPIKIYYNFSKERSCQTFDVELSLTANELLLMVFQEATCKIPQDWAPSNCVLKVAGQNSYLHGCSALNQLLYVVESLMKRKEIEFVLVRMLDMDSDMPRAMEEWNLIDEATGETGSHSDLSALNKEHTQVFTMSMWDMSRKFRVRLVGLDNMQGSEFEVLSVEAGIYHGGELLGKSKLSHEVSATMYPRWNQWLQFDIPIKCLPKAARLCLQVIGGNRQKDTKRNVRRTKSSGQDGQFDRPSHWVNMQILDHRSMLRQGLVRLNLWTVLPEAQKGPVSAQISPMGSTAIIPDSNMSTVLYIELDTYAHPVAFPTHGWGKDIPMSHDSITSSFKGELDTIIYSDPLTKLTPAQKELLWKFRHHCSAIPEALPKVLRCVNWGDLAMVTEIHHLLMIWQPITLEVALELLDYHFADEKVRSLAVHKLEVLSNEELKGFLLQLVQVLKFESYHDSALARFLLKRSLQSKKTGHFFYWYLRSEMDTPEFNQRFGILLEAYLRGCGEAMLQEIQKQHKAVCDIMQVTAATKRQSEKTKEEFARESLSRYQFPESFSPPYDPLVSMGNLNVKKCRVMDSKKAPLWLEFENTDATNTTKKPIKVIAKHGDDLRQDMLTLQMLALMDRIWQSHGLDLHIIPYGCIATGNMMGMIQVVQDAETVAKIQLNQGGSFSALKEEPLRDWLKKKNPTQSEFDAAVERFLLSCAGYCVATYILGIGDRHNDNVMVTTSGNVFHIDFGHFLGNKKFFMGMNRERAPFVLTPDFEYVMGKRNSETFRRFEDTAVKAYMIIRKNANMLINLFSMMKCTGIPELQSVEDLEYLRSVLVLGRTDAEAKDHFRAEIQRCLKLQWSTQLNWFTHNIVHSIN